MEDNATSTKGSDQVEWGRMQVYVPPDFYAVIKERAVRRGVSISAEGLRLMKLGLGNVKPSENIAADLIALRRYLELHVEPLAYIAAVDSAKNIQYWMQQTLGSFQRIDQNTAAKRAETVDRELHMRAVARIQRRLHGVPEAEGENDDDGPEDDGT